MRYTLLSLALCLELKLKTNPIIYSILATVISLSCLAQRPGIRFQEKDGKLIVVDSAGTLLPFEPNDLSKKVSLGHDLYAIGAYTNLKTELGDIYAIINSQNEFLTPFRFEKPKPFENGVSIVTTKQLTTDNGAYRNMALIDTLGNYLIPLVYYKIEKRADNVYFVTPNGQKDKNYFDYLSGLVNQQNETLLSSKYRSIDIIGDLAIVEIDGGSMGVVNLKDEVIIPIEFKYELTVEKNAPAGSTWFKIKKDIVGDNHWLYDDKGSLLADNYKEIKPFENGLAVIEAPYRKGMIDTTGQIIIPIEFGQITKTNWAPKGKRWFKAVKNTSESYPKKYNQENNTFLFDSSGKMLTNDFNFEIDIFRNGFSSIFDKNNGNPRYGIMDTTGNIIIRPYYKYVTLQPEAQAFVVVNDQNRYGLINVEGKTVIPFDYKSLRWNSDLGLFNAISQINQYSPEVSSLIRADGEMGLPSRYRNLIWEPDLKLFRAKDGDNKWGLINREGDVIAPFEFDNIQAFKDGVAVVEQGYLKGFLNAEGKLVGETSYNFQEVKSPTEGLSPVKHKGLWAYMDSLAKEVIPFKYTDAYNFKDGLAIVSNTDKKYGMINKNDEVVIDFKYDGLSTFDEAGIASYKIGDKWGILNNKGNHVTEPKYETLSGFSNGTAQATRSYGARIVYTTIDRSGGESDRREEVRESNKLTFSFSWTTTLTGAPSNPTTIDPRMYKVTQESIEIYNNRTRIHNYNILQSQHHTQDGIPGWFYNTDFDKIFFFGTDPKNGNKFILEGTRSGGLQTAYFISN